jgi:hypothetical protein
MLTEYGYLGTVKLRAMAAVRNMSASWFVDP